jgi:hypothetical protein
MNTPSSTGTATLRSTRTVWQEVVPLCQSCHWWRDNNGRIVTAMTALMILLILAAGALLATRHTMRQDRPLHAPVSHPDWGTSKLPSHPFSDQI